MVAKHVPTLEQLEKIDIRKSDHRVDQRYRVALIGDGGYANYMLKQLLKSHVNVSHFMTSPENKEKLVYKYKYDDEPNKHNLEGITAYEFSDSKTLAKHIGKSRCDYFLVAFYSEKISRTTIKRYNGKGQKRLMNFHPSLLPEFRGPSPIEEMIKADIRYGGITIHLIDGEYDTGDVVGQRRFKLDYIGRMGKVPKDEIKRVAERNYIKSIEEGAELFSAVLRNIEKVHPISQYDLLNKNMISSSALV